MNTLLIANRGEIAVRVRRTAERMGYHCVTLRDGFLDPDAVIAAARDANAWAIHPGYGFLSERPDFAERCAAEGFVFIGPPAAAMRALGDKAGAKKLVASLGLPVLPTYDPADPNIPFPVMVKAAAGGGGRGMRRVDSPDALPAALATARSEARAAFGDDTVLLERALDHPRHIEIQIAADTHGNVIHLGERDCSIQRRYQKLIEEAPSPFVDNKLREQLGNTAVAIARAANYIGLGTLEFLVDDSRAYYFMEANARLQVEHPVTEQITGLDLVEWQLRIAEGGVIPSGAPEGRAVEGPHQANAVTFYGHAIEARLCAEDADRNFLPQTGTVLLWDPPGGDVRVDTALETGTVITPAFDSLLAKIIAHGATRDEARLKLIAALERLTLLGVTTNAAFLADCLRDDRFTSGNATTSFVSDRIVTLSGASAQRERSRRATQSAAALRYARTASAFGAWSDWSANERPPTTLRIAALPDGDPVTVWPFDFAPSGRSAQGDTSNAPYAEDGDRFYVKLDGRAYGFRDLSREPAAAANASTDGVLRAPTTGRVVDVRPDAVILDSMKMEFVVAAPAGTTLATINVKPGDQVAQGEILATLHAGQA